jgi:transposase
MGGARAVEEPQQVQADEEYERVWERVAAIDVAKASGVACTRVPDENRPGRRKTHVWTVTATVPAITELADHLRCHQIQVVTLESTSDYWRIWWVGAGGRRAEGAAGQRPVGEERAGPGQDR